MISIRRILQLMLGKVKPRGVSLTCMRLADMSRVHPDQITGHCSECGAVVGIYPSGQRVLAEMPETKVVCHVCETPSDILVLAPGAEAERGQSRWKQ